MVLWFGGAEGCRVKPWTGNHANKRLEEALVVLARLRRPTVRGLNTLKPKPTASQVRGCGARNRQKPQSVKSDTTSRGERPMVLWFYGPRGGGPLLSRPLGRLVHVFF